MSLTFGIKSVGRAQNEWTREANVFTLENWRKSEQFASECLLTASGTNGLFPDSPPGY